MANYPRYEAPVGSYDYTDVPSFTPYVQTTNNAMPSGTSLPGSGGQYNVQKTGNNYSSLLDMLAPYGTTSGGTTGASTGISTNMAQPRLGSTTMTSQAIKPQGQMPTLTLPELALPGYDESALTGLTQKIASPIVRQQRQLAERALSRHYDNPNVAKMVSGEILRQFGTNLATSLSGARRTATNEYVQKLNLERQKIQAEQQVKQQQALTNYQAALQDYMQQYGTQSTTSYNYTFGTGTGTSNSKNNTFDTWTAPKSGYSLAI